QDLVLLGAELRPPLVVGLLDAVRHVVYSGRYAQHSISTCAPAGRPATPMVVRAGRWAPIAPSYNAFTVAKFPRSVRKMVARATSAHDPSQSSNTARMLARTCSVSGSIPPGTSFPSPPMPTCPASTTKSPARTAGEYGPATGGALGVGTGSTVTSRPSARARPPRGPRA